MAFDELMGLTNRLQGQGSASAVVATLVSDLGHAIERAAGGGLSRHR